MIQIKGAGKCPYSIRVLVQNEKVSIANDELVIEVVRERCTQMRVIWLEQNCSWFRHAKKHKNPPLPSATLCACRWARCRSWTARWRTWCAARARRRSAWWRARWRRRPTLRTRKAWPASDKTWCPASTASWTPCKGTTRGQKHASPQQLRYNHYTLPSSSTCSLARRLRLSWTLWAISCSVDHFGYTQRHRFHLFCEGRRYTLCWDMYVLVWRYVCVLW